MLFKASLNRTMSSNNNTASLVPILDGTNYAQWAVVMKAFLMSIAHWAYPQGHIERALFPDKKKERERLPEMEKEEIHAKQAAFDEKDGVVIGHIVLRTNATIQQVLIECTTSFAMWNSLHETYGKATAPTVFRDFKDCLGAHISVNHDPTRYFDKLFAAFGRMSSAEVAVPPQLQAMIALAALPQKWEMLVSIVTGDIELQDLDLGDVRTAVIGPYQSETVCHSSGKHNANKISAVKCKCSNPNWNQQQGSNQQQRPPNQQNQGQDGQAKRKRGKCGGKGKAKQSDNQHLHITNVTSLVPPNSSTIVLPGPSGVQRRIVTRPTPKQHMPSPYKALNTAIDTAQTSGSKPTIQTVKTLEQCITDTYLESPWAKVSHISDVEDSDVKMHAPQGKEDQGNWVFEEADETGLEASEFKEDDPSFVPLSPSAEPLDWGSDFDDGEVCICPSSLPCLVHTLTELHQPLKRLRCTAGTSEGTARLTSEDSLSTIPRNKVDGQGCRYFCIFSTSVNLGDSKCEHGNLYIFCGRCKERWTKPTWLLDSGASSHFCFNLNDFIKYQKYKPYERTPVTTAAHTIYVEGKGVVVVKHNVNGRSDKTCR